MDARKRTFFDAQARESHWHHPLPDRELKLSWILQETRLAEASKILDVGTGGGVIYHHIRQKLTDFEIFGLDISFKMVKRAAEKRLGAGSLYLVQGDIQTTPFDNDFFDIAFCIAVYPHFNRPVACFREINRVLKSEGRIVIAHTESREEVNAIHSTSHEPCIQNDLLPATVITCEELEGGGFVIEKTFDDEGKHYIEAIKLGS